MKIKANVNLLVIFALVALPLMALAQETNYVPNSSWTITTEDNVNLRPTRFVVTDVDFDGTTEVVFADRKGNNGGYYFGVASVDDIPDAGDGSETWTLEASGKDFGDLTAAPIENKWDVAVIDSNCYFFCEVEISKLAYANGSWSYTALSPLEGGASWLSAQVVDLDDDGTEEIVCAVYDWGDDAHEAVMLLQESGDTLTHTELASLTPYWPGGASRGAVGGAHGDIDQDGYLDFVFGNRAATPDGAIFRLAYLGGTITDPANYELTVIDSGFAGTDGVWSNINIANIDGDAELEVLYTSSVPVGGLFSGTADIAVLDYSGGTFQRADTIAVPEKDLNNGGVGNMISGVDLDGDSNLEIYLVNDNWSDGASELIPRAYKLEYDGTDWQVVWSAVSTIPKQNTWPALTISDLDEDGKSELLWGVVNFTETGNENPPRILAFELASAGSDVMGIEAPVAIEPTYITPTSFALHQNYPNPFNPSTRISFTLNQAMDVQLVVYNLLGREIVSLREGYAKPGYNHVIWNGRNADGLEVPAGIYIARLKGSGHTQSIKMLLLK